MYHRMRREMKEYEVVERRRMGFSVEEYRGFLGSLESREEVWKEVRKVAQEYLAKVFG